MPFDLDRFQQAQDGGAFEQAMAEIRSGRKRSHWIWYVFPQLRGLGSSSFAVRYGLDGEEEAEALLAHPVLLSRLVEAVEAVHAQLTRGDARLPDLMGSEIDTLKLVSSMTLFERVARTAGQDRLAGMAADILAAAKAQGYAACAFTLQELED